MEIQLILLMLLPFAGSLLEATVSRRYAKLRGISAISFSMLTAAVVGYFAVNYDTVAGGAQFVYEQPWISGWNINFKIGLDGIGCIGIVLASILFLTMNIVSITRKSDHFHHSMIMLLQTMVLGFLLSYDYILKVLLWEATWIPLFFLLVTSSKKRFALLYSKQWFFSELLIIVASILLFNTTKMSYDLQGIGGVALNEGNMASLIFFLLVAGSMIRAYVFPFDRYLDRSIDSCDTTISIMTGAVLNLLPFFFMATVVLPMFQRELVLHMHVINAVALAGILICAVRLFIDKKISTIISTQVLMFNCMMFTWFIMSSQGLLGAAIEILAVKTLLNTIIIYSGKEMISGMRKAKGVELWMFSIAIVLSFGIPGIVMIRPLFTLVTAWYSTAPYVSITLTALLAVAFLYTFMNISMLFGPSTLPSERRSWLNLNNAVMAIILLVCVSISVAPDHVHRLSSAGNRTSTGWYR